LRRVILGLPYLSNNPDPRLRPLDASFHLHATV
jgi:hypothetical protein